jgi:hypothetical protein
MDPTVHIPDEAVPALKAKASGLPLETFAEQVLLERIHNTTADGPRQDPRQLENLSDLLLNSPFAGANLDLTRSKDQPRSLGTTEGQAQPLTY